MASRSAPQDSSLPAELTSFVGRRHDIAAVRQLFSATRLVTLTGVGGVGKTRLALRMAQEMRRAFPDGCHLVEFATLNDPTLLAQAVVDKLNVPDQPQRDPRTTLLDYLRSRSLLIILDNCEHLIDATAELATDILTHAPDVHLLATSRQALRVAAEHTYPVSPLLAPAPDHVAEGTAGHYPSVALFADRSAAVLPGFAITRENEADVIRLCNRLEGIPLAIELAAVRMRVLTVRDLADRLDDRFAVLREGTRDLPQRHRTLEALIDWSYDLCTPEQQLLWSRSSVFAGSFTLEALEAICTREAGLSAGLLDDVAALVDKSILIREEHAESLRFRMLEMVREYGHARLVAAEEEESLARRHRDWYAALIERADNDWNSARQQAWVTRLQAEWSNIRQALEYCMTHPGEEAVGLRMASVGWLWSATDHLNEARIWLDRGLTLHTEPTPDRAYALATVGYVAAFQGDEVTAKTVPEQAHELALEIGDLRSLALATQSLAFRQSLGRGSDPREAIPLYEKALALYGQCGLGGDSDTVLVDMAATLVMLNEFDRAAAIVDQVHERSTASGERWRLSYALWLRGCLALFAGELQRAEAELHEALRIKRTFRDTIGIAHALEVLAWTAASASEGERAAMLFGTADRVWHMVGERRLYGRRSRYESAARELLGDAAFDAAVARGARLDLDEAIAFALRESRPAESETAGRLANSGLTPREREVAELVADGLSNKEIASKLVISLRTAEGHVERILSKLGFKTRVQVASWVTEQTMSEQSDS